MNTATNTKPQTVKPSKGMYSRGMIESCPPDHLTDCVNCIFPGSDMMTIREPITTSSIIAGRQIVSYFVASVAGGACLLTLDNAGILRDETHGGVVLANWSGGAHIADDFAAINIFGRTYLCPKFAGKAKAGEHLYYYDGVNIALAGAPYLPLLAPVLAQVNPGNIAPGVHNIAVSFLYSTGYLSPPSPIATIASVGGRDIELSVIPTGGGNIVARVLLMTKANQTELFFVPGGTINDDITTVGTINVVDEALIESADYLNDILAAIPSASALRFYKGRLVLIGQDQFPDDILISDQLSPETFNQVTGIVHIPVDYGINTSNTGAVIRDILYIMKPNGTYATQDNGDVPGTWNVTLIDSGLGAWDNGISIIPTSLSSQDVFDTCFLIHASGLRYFDGNYSKVPLTYKIQGIWDLIDPQNIQYLQVAHDAWNRRVYVAVPLTYPSTPGDTWKTTANTAKLTALLMMDYNEGLDPLAVKWSIWTSGNFLNSGIKKISVENFTLNYAPGTVPIYQVSFCNETTTIFKVFLADSNRTQLTSKNLPDVDETGNNYFPILQYIASPDISYSPYGIYTFSLFDMTIRGWGKVTLKIANKDRSVLVTVNGFQLENFAGKNIQRLINFTNESLIVIAIADQSIPGTFNGFIQVDHINVYGRKMWGMRPCLDNSGTNTFVEVPTVITVMSVNMAGPTDINPPRLSHDGDILIIFIAEDGNPVTWNIEFRDAPDIPQVANTLNILTFFGRSRTGLWYNSGESILGRHV